MASPPKPPTGMEEFQRIVLDPFTQKGGGHPRNSEYILARSHYRKRRTGEKQDHVFIYKDKESGIEPGCLVFKATDDFYKQINTLLIKKLKQLQLAITAEIPIADSLQPFAQVLIKKSRSKEEKINIIERHIRHLESSRPQNNPIFKKFFSSGISPACEEQLMLSYVGMQKQLPLRSQQNMIFLKGDFSNGVLVSVGAERTMVTSPMKALKKKLGGKITKGIFGEIYNLIKMGFKKTKNLDFTKETLVNNLALSYGMKGQTASIKPGLYKDGTPMLMNAQTWAKGFSTFEGRLKGGKKKSGSCIAKELDPEMQELIKKTPSLQRIEFQSDNTIKGIPQSLAFFLQAGDYDMLGSTGGNKGLVNNELYAIDFGHSLETHGIFEDNGILSDGRGKPNLRDDFRFKQPGKTIKHIDAFYDHPLSEMMQGMYFMMRQNNLPISRDVLTWYENKAKETDKISGKLTFEAQAAKNFLEKLYNVVPGSAVTLFDDYIAKFTEAERQLPGKYSGYAKNIQNLKKKYLARAAQFLKIFEKRIGLTPDELTLIENVEKLLCDPKYITNTSADGTVLLNHLRVDFNHRVPCQMKKIPDGIELRIDAKDRKKFEHFKEIIRLFAHKYDKNITLAYRYDEKTKQIVLSCPTDEVELMMKAFQENNIAEYRNKLTATSLQPKLATIAEAVNNKATPESIATPPVVESQPTVSKVSSIAERFEAMEQRALAEQHERHVKVNVPKPKNPPKQDADASPASLTTAFQQTTKKKTEPQRTTTDPIRPRPRPNSTS